MYCKHCGHEINDNAVICPNCGVATDNYLKTSAPAQKNIMALIGFILSFFATVAGLIVSIIAYKNAQKPEYNGDGKNMALAGIIISVVSIGISLIVGILVSIFWFGWLMSLPIYS